MRDGRVDNSALDGGPGILHLGTAAPFAGLFGPPKNRPKRPEKSRQGFSGLERDYLASVTLFTHAYMTSSKNPAGWGSRAGGSYVGARY